MDPDIGNIGDVAKIIDLAWKAGRAVAAWHRQRRRSDKADGDEGGIDEPAAA